MGNGAGTRKKHVALHRCQTAELKEPGSVTVEIVKGKSMPNLDVGSLSDCYVKAKWLPHKDDKEPLEGVELRTLTRRDSLDPVWHENLTFPFIPPGSAMLHIEVYDKDLATADDFVGTASVEYAQLKKNGTVDLPLDMVTKKRGDGASSITVRFVTEVHGDAYPPCQRSKILYLIRHGQSKWNEAQSKKKIGDMIKETDHALTLEGVEQAEDLQDAWSQTYPKEADQFKKAGRVVCSPLTRAVQTALVSLSGLPALRAGGLTLLRNLREIKNFGSFDTVSASSGAAIGARAQEQLATVMDKTEASSYFKGVTIHPHDAVNNWWTPLHVKENDAMTKRRLDALWQHIRYTEEPVQIIVGHSHLFRSMMRNHLSPSLRKSKPQWADTADKCVMDNGACMCIRVDWETRTASAACKMPLIVQADMVFGTKLKAPEEIVEEKEGTDNAATAASPKAEEKASEDPFADKSLRVAAAKPKAEAEASEDPFAGFTSKALTGGTRRNRRSSVTNAKSVLNVLSAI